MATHYQALRAFSRRLRGLLMLRAALQWAAAWLFSWGVIVLALRLSQPADLRGLYLGLLGAVPVALFAAWREHRKRLSQAPLRAAYDGLGRCGGIVMASEQADVSAWENILGGAHRPVLRWRAGRTVGLFALATAFVAVTLLLPERMTALGPKPLQAGQILDELKAEVEVLKEEKILEPEKAADLQAQLEKIEEKSSATDPHKTWEALDHIKESNSSLARQAAEEALAKTSTLTEAETLAQAVQMAEAAGVAQETTARLAREMAALLKSAQLDSGLLNASLPPELLAGLENQDAGDLGKLLRALQSGKGALGKTLTNLAKLRLIDAKSLGQCKSAGTCSNPAALAAFLCENTNSSCAGALAGYGRGGLNRGRGDAPMSWKDESSEQGARFKEEVLPASQRLSEAQTVGVSTAAPELGDDTVPAASGALANAAAGGGGAHSQTVLPRHKQTVQRYFNRPD